MKRRPPLLYAGLISLFVNVCVLLYNFVTDNDYSAGIWFLIGLFATIGGLVQETIREAADRVVATIRDEKNI